jgi:hypothetical protein
MAVCEYCQGTGKRRIGEHKIEVLCSKCHGSGEVKGMTKVEVEEIRGFGGCKIELPNKDIEVSMRKEKYAELSPEKKEQARAKQKEYDARHLAKIASRGSKPVAKEFIRKDLKAKPVHGAMTCLRCNGTADPKCRVCLGKGSVYPRTRLVHQDSGKTEEYRVWANMPKEALLLLDQIPARREGKSDPAGTSKKSKALGEYPVPPRVKSNPTHHPIDGAAPQTPKRIDTTLHAEDIIKQEPSAPSKMTAIIIVMRGNTADVLQQLDTLLLSNERR